MRRFPYHSLIITGAVLFLTVANLEKCNYNIPIDKYVNNILYIYRNLLFFFGIDRDDGLDDIEVYSGNYRITIDQGRLAV